MIKCETNMDVSEGGAAWKRQTRISRCENASILSISALYDQLLLHEDRRLMVWSIDSVPQCLLQHIGVTETSRKGQNSATLAAYGEANTQEIEVRANIE